MIYKFRNHGYCIISDYHILVHDKSDFNNSYSNGIRLNIKETKDSIFAFDNNCILKLENNSLLISMFENILNTEL
jgi:hypothetical protein